MSNTFASHFLPSDKASEIIVPDYQRSYSWKKEQIDLFIQDLIEYEKTGNYYFGHFICELHDGRYELVDGQQRVTTFILFLIVCRQFKSELSLKPNWYDLINNFKTVGYDQELLGRIISNLPAFLEQAKSLPKSDKITPEELLESLGEEEPLTDSQFLLLRALLHFHEAFESLALLNKGQVEDYIKVIGEASCSLHKTEDKSVAVNIFEMHNTRGVALTTMEVVKAKLMQAAYKLSTSVDSAAKNVKCIQESFGQIYKLESKLKNKFFDGELTLDQLFANHLRIIDDGKKTTEEQFKSPSNTGSKDVLSYLDEQLAKRKDEEGIEYVKNLSAAFKDSMQFMAETVHEWDRKERLVGDCVILRRDRSVRFLLLCNKVFKGDFSSLPEGVLGLWEKLLFTYNFHDGFYRVSHNKRSNFEKLFAEFSEDPKQLQQLLEKYLHESFNPSRANNLPEKVRNYLEDKANRDRLLNSAYNWWPEKTRYMLYKFEADKLSEKPLQQLRAIMHDKTSIEHILPREWSEHIESASERESMVEPINKCINGIGNLLIISSSKNSALGNKHPEVKKYDDLCAAGTYSEHSSQKWNDPKEWENIIRVRGERIIEYMLNKLVGAPSSEKWTLQTANYMKFLVS